MHSLVSLVYKVSETGTACTLRAPRAFKTGDNELLMLIDSYGYRVRKRLEMNNAYFCITIYNEVRNHAQNKDVTAK